MTLGGDDEFVRADIDPFNQAANQFVITLIGMASHSFPESRSDNAFNFGCGNPMDGSGKLFAALQEA
jgi:hypothetical protein